MGIKNKLNIKSQSQLLPIFLFSLIIGVFLGYFVVADSFDLYDTIKSTHYTGDYRILSQLGTEAGYEVNMKKVEIDLDNEVSIQGTQICIKAIWDDDSYPTNIPLYINNIAAAEYYDFEIEEEIEQEGGKDIIK